jgi:hypothetical protein
MVKRMRRSERGSAALSIVVVAVIMLVAGAALSYAYLSTTGVSPTSQHQAIVNAIVIMDTSNNFNLVAKCLDASAKPFAKLAVTGFVMGAYYQQSLWLFQTPVGHDTYFALKIWGPNSVAGYTGDEYTLEFGKMTTDAFTITIGNITIWTIPSVSLSSQYAGQGYYWDWMTMTGPSSSGTYTFTVGWNAS